MDNLQEKASKVIRIFPADYEWILSKKGSLGRRATLADVIRFLVNKKNGETE